MTEVMPYQPTAMQALQSQPVYAPVQQNALIELEQKRVLAEVQGSVLMAKQFPRDEFQAEQKLKRMCDQFSFAENAEYQLPVGGKSIPGPSIRLFECLAQCWGNIEFGVRRLNTGEDKDGVFADCEAFAWDKESNTRVPAIFRVYFFQLVKDYDNPNKDSKKRKIIADPLEQMRMINSYGSRYVRNCLARVCPNYLVEKALEWSRETVKKGEGSKPLIERCKGMILAFAPLGVDQSQIEGYARCKLELWNEEIFTELKRIYKTIRDGEAKAQDFFTGSEADEKRTGKAAAVAAKLGV